jgi:hypothetical protein
MIEEEFSHKEKFEFEDRLSRLKALMNDAVLKLDSDFFIAGADKNSTKVGNVYYAGGTLCLDLVTGEYKCLIMLNISDETITIIVGNKTSRHLMSLHTLWFAFTVYKEVKGLTEYYKHCYDNSCIRHLYSIMMNRRKPGDPVSSIEDFVINHLIIKEWKL